LFDEAGNFCYRDKYFKEKDLNRSSSLHFLDFAHELGLVDC